MGSLERYINLDVLVLLYDGRLISGNFKGHDPHTNIILSNSVERLFSTDEPVELVPLGLYMIRGDNIALIAELDPDLEASFDFSEARAEPINPISFI
ncbi:Small Nuclear ribonucleoprotein splicing factor [Phaffia rhodozyma]|uniref:LSM2-LSM8 complex subunit LSM8 n=1 Tax=Phaffia rhodozyma TaxID=264483 RepID=A0A0F7SH08_PHARH|nr:Small Nuclear ribonucleoprotein splicing factor [Phaffia rhodozyma]